MTARYKRLNELYRVQDCETGLTWNPVVQTVPLDRVGPHLVNTCSANRPGLSWYFSWKDRVLWLVSEV